MAVRQDDILTLLLALSQAQPKAATGQAVELT